MKSIYKIGITGGIASGKSRCLGHLKESYSSQIYTMNLDEFAFKVYKLNPSVLRNLKTIFGA